MSKRLIAYNVDELYEACSHLSAKELELLARSLAQLSAVKACVEGRVEFLRFLAKTADEERPDE